VLPLRPHLAIRAADSEYLNFEIKDRWPTGPGRLWRGQIRFAAASVMKKSDSINFLEARLQSEAHKLRLFSNGLKNSLRSLAGRQGGLQIDAPAQSEPLSGVLASFP
jgi:hypothetical protein